MTLKLLNSILRPSYLHFQSTAKSHAELSVVVFAEDSLEGLLEQRRVEGIAHDNVAPKTKQIISAKY